jgi:hypothetical protein
MGIIPVQVVIIMTYSGEKTIPAHLESPAETVPAAVRADIVDMVSRRNYALTQSSRQFVGPTYCGSGCSSNCEATAACGRYAAKPGTTCPLNTCCSKHGFCGTSEDFCDAECQSNCELHPKPSAGGGQVLDRGNLSLPRLLCYSLPASHWLL